MIERTGIVWECRGREKKKEKEMEQGGDRWEAELEIATQQRNCQWRTETGEEGQERHVVVDSSRLQRETVGVRSTKQPPSVSGNAGNNNPIESSSSARQIDLPAGYATTAVHTHPMLAGHWWTSQDGQRERQQEHWRLEDERTLRGERERGRTFSMYTATAAAARPQSPLGSRVQACRGTS